MANQDTASAFLPLPSLYILYLCPHFSGIMINENAIQDFDPNAPGLKSNNIFGLPHDLENSELIIIPVPWEVTVSYRPGTARGPEQVFDESLQVDLFDPEYTDMWKKGYYMVPLDKDIRLKSDYLRGYAELILGCLYEGGAIDTNKQLCHKLREVNDGGIYLKNWLFELSSKFLKEGKKVVILGGDHSTPLGYIQALGNIYPDFGILQIDAHADLRKAYEGFTYSHASIMYNVLNEVPQVSKLVQVGTRDYCDEEAEYIRNNSTKVKTFFDISIKEAQYEGKNWVNICHNIIDILPENVYLSFDIDGLDPKLCPNTGTPVPGGFELEQVFYLIKLLKKSGRKFIGFDLNEISSGAHGNDCIDPIVGARTLYKLCNILAAE